MSKAAQRTFGATVADRWQIPLLAIGITLLLSGLIRMAVGYEEFSFEQEIEKVEELRLSGALTRGNAYVLHLLKETKRPFEERGELHRRLIGLVHDAERRFKTHKPRNRRSIISNFQTALRYGVEPEASDWLALADAYDWSGMKQDAMDAFREALKRDPARPDRALRRLVELQEEPGKPISLMAAADLDAILASDQSSPGNYRWALERKVNWLLGRDEPDQALVLMSDGKKRLAGSSELPAVTYLEALCLRHVGKSAESNLALRGLRNDWSVRDELWGKAGWLLGKLEQEDERPQEALTFYEDVLSAFQAGMLYDLCELGRAECLLMLQRHERALAVFRRLRGLTAAGADASRLDRDAVRTTITTIGDAMVLSGDLALGLEYLKLAASMVDDSDMEQRSRYAARIAGALARLARERTSSPGTEDAKSLGQALHGEAAEVYLLQANLHPWGDEASADAMLLAAENFNAAGMTGKLVEALNLFIQRYKSDWRRPSAFYRLGEAYRSLRDDEGAMEAYETVIGEYPRFPAALSSMVPLARVKLRAGGEHAAEGVRILEGITDDLGEDHLFSPEAQEYRDALVELVEHLSAMGESRGVGYFEKAIPRLEQALALYPDDPIVPRLTFLLAEAYRRSAEMIRADDEIQAAESATVEGDRRMRAALAHYTAVKALLAPVDASSLDGLEETYLRVSYLYIGDCLFDLGEFERAVEAYREAAWRYENRPAAVLATVQVVHCYQRLGRSDDARAALARAGWLLKKIPASAFDTGSGMSSKAYWQAMVARMERVGDY